MLQLNEAILRQFKTWYKIGAEKLSFVAQEENWILYELPYFLFILNYIFEILFSKCSIKLSLMGFSINSYDENISIKSQKSCFFHCALISN